MTGSTRPAGEKCVAPRSRRVNDGSSMETTDSEPRWFCIRSQPRRQHVAASHLRSLGIEVFNPVLRFQRPTRRGPVWSTAPLFPNYLFARFELLSFFRAARYAFGVSDILRFGGRWAEMPDAEIAELQTIWSHGDAIQPPQRLEVGSPVILTGGLFHGVEATVIALLPARQRVKVLLEFLGGLKETEVATDSVLPPVSHPLAF
jgi:transcriptional antiterminator RfaH